MVWFGLLVLSRHRVVSMPLGGSAPRRIMASRRIVIVSSTLVEYLATSDELTATNRLSLT